MGTILLTTTEPASPALCRGGQCSNLAPWTEAAGPPSSCPLSRAPPKCALPPGSLWSGMPSAVGGPALEQRSYSCRVLCGLKRLTLPPGHLFKDCLTVFFPHITVWKPVFGWVTPDNDTGGHIEKFKVHEVILTCIPDNILPQIYLPFWVCISLKVLLGP